MKKFLLFGVLLFVGASSFSQNNFWKKVEANQVAAFTKDQQLFPGSFKPSVYKLFSLDETTLGIILKQARIQSVSKSDFIIAIPVADGSIKHFRITESPVMQPKLQAKYPNIRSYAGQGIEDASSVIHFDFTPLGFHAIIISPDKSTVYINPVSTAKQLYLVFDRSNITQQKQVFDCNLDKILNSNVQGITKPSTTGDASLKTYRFAVTTGGEFSQLCLNGSETNNTQKKASVLSVLVTDLVRTNAIFETDFGVHLNYVDNEDTIIFLNGGSDPYQSSANGYFSGRWNTQAQTALDSYIGSSNYDIGHLLMGYGTGGNAGCIGCVCDNSLKGSGATGFKTDLTTDPFIVDFWDHEIGHQFGANHTFDYSFEGTIAQMEPGSGSTMMGYAGYTGSTDIQQHSDAYFHAVSIQQVNTYITTGMGASCAVVTQTGNHVPTVKAGKDYIIPKSTPFALTANGSDGDVSDSLTYCWEQYDVVKNNGTSKKFPDSTATTGPTFRSLTPVTSDKRNFPALNSILNGTNFNKWEVLPAVSRALNFRVTVRDNSGGGGSTNTDDMVVTVSANAGPFTVTSPNTNVSWKEGSQHVVKWNVANTNAAPVNCTHVNITLSLDGGNTFPINLKSNILNDGAANIVLPMQTSNNARIKVVAADNIFFDISDKDFKITAAGKPENSIASNIAVTKIISVQPNPANSYTNIVFNAAVKNCILILTNAEGKVVLNKTVNSVSKGFAEKISLQQFTKGVYFLKISTDGQTQTEKIIID
jgi:reprolysin-like metallo-peptidase family M12B/type IX secretion system substrate protein